MLYYFYHVQREVVSMQTVLVVMLVVVCAGTVAISLYREHRDTKKLRLRVQKLYASQLFEDMMPMLKAARRHSVERVTVDKTGVVLRYFQPRSMETAFLMRPSGYAYLTPEQQEAMRVVLEECLPSLRDQHKYRLSRQRVRLLNGDIEYVYYYTINNAYKAELCRAVNYDPMLQTRSW